MACPSPDHITLKTEKQSNYINYSPAPIVTILSLYLPGALIIQIHFRDNCVSTDLAQTAMRSTFVFVILLPYFKIWQLKVNVSNNFGVDVCPPGRNWSIASTGLAYHVSSIMRLSKKEIVNIARVDLPLCYRIFSSEMNKRKGQFFFWGGGRWDMRAWLAPNLR